MYIYLLKYDYENSIYQLPVPPEKMTTKIQNNNKVYQSIQNGEINILKNAGLKEVTMQILLPNDLSLPFVQSPYTSNCIVGKPIVYLNKFAEFKNKKQPFKLLITRILPNGEEIFKGNINVSLEEYSIIESASENGDFLVDLLFKEYVKIEPKEIVPLSNSTNSYSVVSKRDSKPKSKTYTVKKGDTIWGIAKRELNDETLCNKIIEINSIKDPKNLRIGQVLILP